MLSFDGGCQMISDSLRLRDDMGLLYCINFVPIYAIDPLNVKVLNLSKIIKSAKSKKWVKLAGNPARRCRLYFLKIFECESKSILLWCIQCGKLESNVIIVIIKNTRQYKLLIIVLLGD